MATIVGEEAAQPAGAGAASWLFAGAVLLSAALVFLVEPLLGRLLLPVLGGTAGVWTTSLAFFQAALLLGYAYAHLLQARLPVRRQVPVHLTVLAAAALCLPPRLPEWLGEPWSAAPALWLVLALAVAAGLPFAALSASAPLIQAWCARLRIAPPMGRSVYSLYAASNVGSLIGLVAYPTLVEPLLGLHHQGLLWGLGFVLFCLLLLSGAVTTPKTAWTSTGTPSPVVATTVRRPADSRTTWRERLVWMALAAAPSSLLLGVTGHVSTDVASAPFLWAAPLILYLLTFIIAFGRPRPPGTRLLWAHLALVAAALMSFADPWVSWPFLLALHLGAFFAAALVCHLSLVSRRPEAARLTDFYLAVAAGGMCGGLFNALVAPILFPDVWEYPLVLALSVLARPPAGRRIGSAERSWLIAGSIWTLPLWIPAVHPPGIIRVALLLVPVMMSVAFHRRRSALALLYGNLVIALLAQQAWKFEASYRSFFGVTHVRTAPDKELGAVRMLVHGTTLHGMQPLAPGRGCQPTSYYAAPTTIGQVFATEQARKPAMSMAVSGLGAGVTATFVRASDRLQYFEIDPTVVRIARDSGWFSLLRCARGPVAITVGDARLKLRAQPAGAYDLMMMDAFSSDSVPTHLLTTEAIRESLGHLKPDGVLLIHVSNRNLELTPVAAASARAAGAAVLSGIYYSTEGRSPYATTSSIVVLVARSERTLDRYRGRPGWTSPPTDARPWTDDYTNVLGPFVRRIQIANGLRKN